MRRKRGRSYRKEGGRSKAKQSKNEWERKREQKALGKGGSRANVMQECQLQMERGIYICKALGRRGSHDWVNGPGLHHEENMRVGGCNIQSRELQLDKKC